MGPVLGLHLVLFVVCVALLKPASTFICPPSRVDIISLKATRCIIFRRRGGKRRSVIGLMFTKKAIVKPFVHTTARADDGRIADAGYPVR